MANWLPQYEIREPGRGRMSFFVETSSARAPQRYTQSVQKFETETGANIEVSYTLLETAKLYAEVSSALRSMVKAAIKRGDFEGWQAAREELDLQHKRAVHVCTGCHEGFLSACLVHGACPLSAEEQRKPMHWEAGTPDIIDNGRIDEHTVGEWAE